MTTPADLVVRDGLVVIPDAAVVPRTVVVRDGRIAALLPHDAPIPDAHEAVDAAGLVVLPGMIDGHVHFRDPGFPHKEDFATGSAAAVAGGVTTVLEMPNTDPPTDSVAHARLKVERLTGRTRCDVGLFAVIVDGNLGEIRPLAASGLVVGFKVFLAPTTGDIPTPSDETIRAAMREIRSLGMRLGVHAEDGALITVETARIRGEGRTDQLAHLDARPAAAEARAIERIAGLAAQTGCPIHVYHLSSAPGLEALERARAAGVDATAEVGAQHCFLDAAEMPRIGSRMRVNPPVRRAAEGHQAALLAALADGRIGMIASDHSPHAPAEKLHADIWRAVSGYAGVETTLRLFLTHGIGEGRLTWAQLARAIGEAPARTWGLWPRKGAIALGADADLVLVDPDRPGTIDEAALHGRTNVTPFHGRPTRGAAVRTILRGRTVMRDGERVGEPAGRLVGRA